MSIANFSIQLFKGKRLKDGTHPIVAMTTVAGSVKRISLPKILSHDPRPAVVTDHWDFEERRVSKKHPHRKRINEIIQYHEVRAAEILDRMTALGQSFDHDTFKDQLLCSPDQLKARDRSKTDVFSMFDQIIDEMMKDGRIGTASAYRDAKSALRLYQCAGDQQKARKSTAVMPFTEVATIAKVKAWATFMISRGNSEASAGMRLRQLRAVLYRARAERLIQFDEIPFRNVWNPGGLSVSEYRGMLSPQPMTEQEIQLLLSAAPKEPRSVWALDIFRMLVAMCGAHINDLAYLTKENIRGERIHYRRGKTRRTQRDAVEVSLRITPVMDEIISRYTDTRPYLIPILGVQHRTPLQKKHAIQQATRMVNDRLDVLRKQVGLDRAVTSNAARYTAATTLKNSNVPPDVINELQGRANSGMLKHYAPAHKFEVLDRAQDLLWQKVTGSFGGS